MKRNKVLIGTLLVGVWLVAGGFAAARAQTIGKYVPIPAGSDADKALTEVNAERCHHRTRNAYALGQLRHRLTGTLCHPAWLPRR